ncbi:hypothetical protein L218DRAFT_1072437 [Marasmius fiardii PR-910]|nr:hypothetical protein L218DRAFT_1072437 [Marasmius fiardii PR-910]
MIKGPSSTFLIRYLSTKTPRGIRKTPVPRLKFGEVKKEENTSACDDEKKKHLDTAIAVKALLASVTKFILYTPTERQSTAERFIHRRLSEERFKKATITRQDVFEKIISLLIQHRRFREATTVYERMKREKLCASSITDAQMLAIGLASDAIGPEKAFEGLETIFRGGSLKDESGARNFSEDDFLRLLGAWKALDLPSRSMAHMIRKFISCQQEGYTPSKGIVTLLVGMLVRDGSVDEAFRVIDAYKDQTDDEPGGSNITVEDSDSGFEVTHPYATLISSLPTFDPLSQGAIDRVLTEIRSNEVQIDSSLFTALIMHYAGKREAQKVLSLYDALKKAREDMGIEELRPNVTVFKRLWDLSARMNRRKSEKISQPSPSPRPPRGLRVDRRTRSQTPSTSGASTMIVPPRPIFRDMFQYLYIDANPTTDGFPHLNDAQSLLNLGLRSFLATRDYGGAIVMLETLAQRLTEKMRVGVSGRTFAIVIWELVKRIEEDLIPQNIGNGGKANDSTPEMSVWAYVLLGVRLPRGSSLREHYQNDRLVDFILNRNRSALENGSSSSSPSSGDRPVSSRGRARKVREAFPTFAIVHGTKPVPPGVVLSVRPLLEMLKKALILHTYPNLTTSMLHSYEGLTVPHLCLGTILERTAAMIENTRKEMLPPDGVRLLTKGR